MFESLDFVSKNGFLFIKTWSWNPIELQGETLEPKRLTGCELGGFNLERLTYWVSGIELDGLIPQTLDTGALNGLLDLKRSPKKSKLRLDEFGARKRVHWGLKWLKKDFKELTGAHWSATLEPSEFNM